MLDPILEEIKKVCVAGDGVCDIFSGTLAVSMALKQNGYRVISNDINSFSYAFGRAYLENNHIPELNYVDLGINEAEFSEKVNEKINLLKGSEGFLFLEKELLLEQYIKLITLCLKLESLANNNNLPKVYRKTFFFDSYTQDGANSAFASSRGSQGKRKFFTPENGKKIDYILNQIRFWLDNNFISETLYYVIISIVCESVEKISNTQGTFHDFQREKYDSRALKTLSLRLPPFDTVLSGNLEHIVGKERDSLEFIKEVPRHKLLYLDPPYNFRQYTSYYFMLNLICSYCKIPDLESEFRNIQYVRGQNMSRDFKSTFCKKAQFVSSVEQLIEDANTEYVLLSYFDGRNHSLRTAEKGEVNGIEELEHFFNGPLFEPGTFRLIPIKRLNYQSFKEHKARELNEYLFFAKKK